MNSRPLIGHKGDSRGVSECKECVQGECKEVQWIAQEVQSMQGLCKGMQRDVQWVQDGCKDVKRTQGGIRRV